MKFAIEGCNGWLVSRLALMAFLVNISALGYCIFGNFDDGALAGLLLTYSVSFNEDVIMLALNFV